MHRFLDGKTLSRILLIGALLLTLRGSESLRAEESADSLLFYVGTYTGKESRGIYLGRLHLDSGRIENLGLAAEVKNPSFLAIHPDGRHLYAVSELSKFEGKKSGGVTAFRIEPGSGKLTRINAQVTAGRAPCHINVDATGRNLLTANYGGGNCSVVRIQPDGSLGEVSSFQQHEGSSVNPRRQKGPHAHSINLDAANRHAFVADLGVDRVFVYDFDAVSGKLVPNDPPSASVKPGAGPRHFCFHPSGRFAYLINELHSTVTTFAYDATEGSLRELETITTLPLDYRGGNSTAEVLAHPSGRFLYGSNRGHDSIAVFAIDAATGTLTPVEHEPTGGKTPRNFVLDPTGRYLLAENQNSDSVVVFRIDSETGALEPAGHRAEFPTPVCIRFLKGSR